MIIKELPTWYSDLTLEGDFGGLVNGVNVIANGVDYKLPIFNDSIENLLFFRIHRFSSIFFAGQGGVSGKCWLKNVLKDEYDDLGPTFGTLPIAFWKYYIYIVRNANSCDVVNITDLSLHQTIHDEFGVDGIRDIDSGGAPILARFTYDGSKTVGVAEYNTLGDVIIGQGYNGGAILIEGNLRKEIEPGDCRFIHSYRNWDSLACSITKQTEGRSIYLWFDVNEIDNFKNETKVTPQEPPKEEPKKEIQMILPDFANSVVQTLYNLHKDLANGDDDQRRELTKMIVEQITFLDPNGRWGHKADIGHPPSKDTLGKIGDGVLLAWDLFNGSTREPNNHPISFELVPSTQEVRLLPGVNHLGSVVNEPEPKDEPGPVNNNEVIQKLDEIINLLNQNLTELKAQNTSLTKGLNELKDSINKGIKVRF